MVSRFGIIALKKDMKNMLSKITYELVLYKNFTVYKVTTDKTYVNSNSDYHGFVYSFKEYI